MIVTAFFSELIVHAVWLYARFTLSFRDVEDLLAERGLDVPYETVRRWFLKFSAQIASNLRTNQPVPSDHRYLDEMVIIIGGSYGEQSIMKERYWTFWFSPEGTPKPLES